MRGRASRGGRGGVFGLGLGVLGGLGVRRKGKGFLMWKSGNQERTWECGEGPHAEDAEGAEEYLVWGLCVLGVGKKRGGLGS